MVRTKCYWPVWESRYFLRVASEQIIYKDDILLNNLFTMQMRKKLGEAEKDNRRAMLDALQSIICLSVLSVPFRRVISKLPSEVKLCQVNI